MHSQCLLFYSSRCSYTLATKYFTTYHRQKFVIWRKCIWYTTKKLIFLFDVNYSKYDYFIKWKGGNSANSISLKSWLCLVYIQATYSLLYIIKWKGGNPANFEANSISLKSWLCIVYIHQAIYSFSWKDLLIHDSVKELPMVRLM